MSNKIVTRKNVWDFYDKLSDWKAKCRLCSREHIYVHDSYFFVHMEDKHVEIFQREKYKRRQEWPWVYFKYLYNDTSYTCSQCLLCGDYPILSYFEYLVKHLRKHFKKEVEDFVHQGWIWKYYKRDLNNSFKLKCMMCDIEYIIPLSSSLNDHIVKEHPDILRNAQKTHDIIAPSKQVQSKANIISKLHQYYIKLPYFQAKCKIQYCDYRSYYISLASFNEHVRQKHILIFDYETTNKTQISRYFKHSYAYNSDKEVLYSECLICGVFFLSASESEVTNHLYEHSQKERDDFDFSTTSNNFYQWELKYCIPSGDYNKIKCNICCKIFSITFNSNISNHINKKSKEMLQLYIVAKACAQKLWRNYEDLGNFQAKCKFQNCDFQYCYVNTTKFSEHVKEKHIEIFQYEETYRERWPFRHFKYLNPVCLQCCRCNAICSSNNEHDLINHILYVHSHDTLTYFDDCDWEQKYYKKNGDFEVQCDLCLNEIFLDVSLSYFNRHIEDEHPNRLTNTERTYDIAGPSGSQPN